jgi:hypothetical protein
MPAWSGIGGKGLTRLGALWAECRKQALGYAWLWGASVAVMPVPAAGWILLCSWWLWVCMRAWSTVRHGQSRQPGITMAASAIVQAPACAAALASAGCFLVRHTDLWASGILQLWTYPFTPLYLLLPPQWPMGAHISYWAACVTPFALAFVQVVLVLGFSAAVTPRIRIPGFPSTQRPRQRKTLFSKWVPLPSAVQSAPAPRQTHRRGEAQRLRK